MSPMPLGGDVEYAVAKRKPVNFTLCMSEVKCVRSQHSCIHEYAYRTGGRYQ